MTHLERQALATLCGAPCTAEDVQKRMSTGVTLGYVYALLDALAENPEAGVIKAPGVGGAATTYVRPDVEACEACGWPAVDETPDGHAVCRNCFRDSVES